MGRSVVGIVSVVALAAAGSASAVPSKPPSALVLRVGPARAYTAAELRPGTRVTCVDSGRALSVTVPGSRFVGSGTVWTQAGRRFHLNLDPRAGGGYLVRCGLGAVHWVAVPQRRAAPSYLAI
jgi:hypothetical protein